MTGLFDALDRANVAWRSIFENSSEENNLSVAPIIFKINLSKEKIVNSNLIEWICKKGRFSSNIMLIASSLPEDLLVYQLNKRLNAVLPDGIDILLRYYDPRVFESLCKILLKTQNDAFLGIASCWWYVDRSGHIQQQIGNQAHAESEYRYLNIEMHQQNALIEESLPDQIAEKLFKFAQNYFIKISASERHKFIKNNIESAQLFNVKKMSDLVIFCGLALQEGKDFFTLPIWKEKLELVLTGQKTLTQILEN